MKTTLLPNQITIINDGQVQYPVASADLAAFLAAHGEITTGNYELFCSTVENLGEPQCLTGSREMIDLCDQLVADGAATLHPN